MRDEDNSDYLSCMDSSLFMLQNILLLKNPTRTHPLILEESGQHRRLSRGHFKLNVPKPLIYRWEMEPKIYSRICLQKYCEERA